MPQEIRITIVGVTNKGAVHELIKGIEDILGTLPGDFKLTVDQATIPLKDSETSHEYYFSEDESEEEDRVDEFALECNKKVHKEEGAKDTLNNQTTSFYLGTRGGRGNVRCGDRLSQLNMDQILNLVDTQDDQMAEEPETPSLQRTNATPGPPSPGL